MKTTTTSFISSKKNIASLVITWADKHRRITKGHHVSYSVFKDTIWVDLTMPEAETALALANLKMILG